MNWRYIKIISLTLFTALLSVLWAGGNALACYSAVNGAGVQHALLCGNAGGAGARMEISFAELGLPAPKPALVKNSTSELPSSHQCECDLSKNFSPLMNARASFSAPMRYSQTRGFQAHIATDISRAVRAGYSSRGPPLRA